MTGPDEIVSVRPVENRWYSFPYIWAGKVLKRADKNNQSFVHILMMHRYH